MEITDTRERGTSTVEFVGVAAAVTLLLGGIGVGMSAHGRAIAGSVAAGIERAIRGATADRAARAAHDEDRGAGDGPVPELPALSTARERRWETDDDAPRVSRSDLQMNPVLPGGALRSSTRTASATGPAGISATASATACLVCIDAGWRDGFRTGLTTSNTLRPTNGEFVTAELQAEGRVAVIGLDLIGIVQQRTGWLDWKAQGRVRSTLGMDADARLVGKVRRDGFELTAGGGAMAGGVIRGEARAGVDLLGIAVTARGRAEGWAGAGARANASVSRRGSTFSWDAELGAALGLGGSLEWGGSVDVSKVSPKHRAAATTTLATAASFLLPGAHGFFQQFTRPKDN